MATLLPVAEQQFLDQDGAPLVGGQVWHYVPGTSRPKDTWSDPGGSVLNTNPVILDGAGRATIYGVGAYRQVVKDALGDLVLDAVTADTSSAGASWASTAGGTANNLVLAAPNFASTDGQAIDFLAGLTNTGPLQATVNGTTVPVKLDTLGGPVQTPAGAVVAGLRYRLTYDAVGGFLHLTPVVDRAYVDAATSGTSAGSQSYAAQQAAAALATAEAYAGQVAQQQAMSALNGATANAFNNDQVILGQAQTYAAGQAQGAIQTAESFATAADTGVLASANNYAAGQAASALQQAQTYAANQANGALSQAVANTNSQVGALTASAAATYVRGVRLAAGYSAQVSGRQPGSVVISAGASASANYAYLQYNVNGQWVTAADA